MTTVYIHGYREGWDKVATTKLLREHMGWLLDTAKTCTDQVLGHGHVTFETPTNEQAAALVAALNEAGANARIVDPSELPG
jgi:ribosomal protein L7/L12